LKFSLEFLEDDFIMYTPKKHHYFMNQVSENWCKTKFIRNRSLSSTTCYC